MFQRNIPIAGPFIVCAAMAATGAAQAQKPGGGHGGPAAAAPHAAVPHVAAAPHAAPAPHIAAPHAAPAPHIAAPRQAPHAAPAPRAAPRHARQAPVAAPRQAAHPPAGPGGAFATAPSTHGGHNAGPRQNAAAQPNTPARQGVMQPNEAARAIPRSATRARAAINPRAFSGGALRNQSFANLAGARDPGARTLARSTFQGRFFDPQWRRRSTYPNDTFWPYAYDDVYDGMFGAYAVGYGGTYASVGPRGQGGDYRRRGAPHGRSAARGVSGGRSIEVDLCSGQTAGLTDWPIERISQTVEPNDQQRAILDELRDATAKALDQLKAACPTALPSTPTGRIEAMRQRLDAMLAAVRTVRPVLEKFYDSLNDEQKARFNALSPEASDPQQGQRSLAQVCGERASGIASLPLERIERAVEPDGTQRNALKELQDAAAQAANLLSSECPTYPQCGRPATSDGAAARRDAPGGRNRAAGAREVLFLAQRRAEGALQSPPRAGLMRE